MSTLELAIKKTWEDVDKLTTQIESILQALKDKSEIVQVEAGLVPLISTTAPPQTTTTGKGSSASATAAAHRHQGKKHKGMLLPDSDDEQEMAVDDDWLIQDSQCPNNAEPTTVVNNLSKEIGSLSFRVIAPNNMFIADESETFLIPLMDRWIWGTTVQNQFRSFVKVPELYLSIPPLQMRSGSPFTYSYSITLLDASPNNKDSTQSHPMMISRYFTIPYQKLRLSNREEEKLSGETLFIPPGGKAWVTAQFSNPTNQLSGSSVGGKERDKISVLISLICDEIHQWSKLVEIKSIHGVTLHKDEIFKKFQPQIFSALAMTQDSFKLERPFCQAEKAPMRALEKLLVYLDFEKIHAVLEDPVRKIENHWFTSNKMSLLYGFLVKLEKNSSDHSCMRCSVCARSHDQMQLFIKILANWLQKENHNDRKRGIKGMMLTTLFPKQPADLSNLLFEELEILSHLVLLNHKDLANSEEMSTNWLSRYITTLSQTDMVFRQYMKPSFHTF